MSDELVRWALTVDGLSPRAFRVLVAMSTAALWKGTGHTPALTYFGGLERLGLALDPEHRLKPSARNRAAYRAVAELVDRGVVQRVDSGRPGRFARYRLVLRMPGEWVTSTVSPNG